MEARGYIAGLREEERRQGQSMLAGKEKVSPL